MKKILCLLAIIALFCAMVPIATAENEVYLRLAGDSGKVGELVEVELNSHDVYGHIGEQILRFGISTETDKYKLKNKNTCF